MDKGFDVGEYFYRSCNLIPEFAEYRSECPNLEHYSACVVTLLTHTESLFPMPSRWLTAFSISISVKDSHKKFSDSFLSCWASSLLIEFLF